MTTLVRSAISLANKRLQVLLIRFASTLHRIIDLKDLFSRTDPDQTFWPPTTHAPVVGAPDPTTQHIMQRSLASYTKGTYRFTPPRGTVCWSSHHRTMSCVMVSKVNMHASLTSSRLLTRELPSHTRPEPPRPLGASAKRPTSCTPPSSAASGLCGG